MLIVSCNKRDELRGTAVDTLRSVAAAHSDLLYVEMNRIYTEPQDIDKCQAALKEQQQCAAFT
jgi:hypothetical protein